MHLRCLLRYVLSNNWISISIKYCNFTFANGLQICVDASTSACILALAGEAQDNLAIQEVSQMAPFGLWHKVLQKLPRLGTWHKACSETLPEAFFAGYFVLPDFQVKLSIWSETSLNQSQPCWIWGNLSIDAPGSIHRFYSWDRAGIVRVLKRELKAAQQRRKDSFYIWSSWDCSWSVILGSCLQGVVWLALVSPRHWLLLCVSKLVGDCSLLELTRVTCVVHAFGWTHLKGQGNGSFRFIWYHFAERVVSVSVCAAVMHNKEASSD